MEMRSGTTRLMPDRFRKRKGPSGAGECLLICLCSFALLVIEAQSPAVQEARSVGELVKMPIHAAVRLVSAGFRGSRDFLRSQASLKRENEELHATILEQDVDLQRMAMLRAENEELRHLHSLNAQLGSENLTAQTLPGNPDPTRHRVTLSIGSSKGAFVGQPVVDSEGVVGQVERDYLITSDALLISDANHAMPVMFERTGQRAIAYGTGRSDHRLLLQYMPAHSDVTPGDIVVSSGVAGVFPAGLRVGVLEDVRNATGQAFLEAFVRPAANLDGVNLVLLLRNASLQPDEEAPGDAPAES